MTEDSLRSLTQSRWRPRSGDEAAAEQLRRELGVHEITARALVSRGLADAAAARSFLSDDLSGLADPFALADMARAVGAVEAALERKALIRICGDYDVDGVCATALLVRALRGLGGTVDWHVPHRVDEGYGLSEEAVRRAAADGVELLITADCGTTAVAAIAVARDLGIEVVVTDHHRPEKDLPPAAVLNPWREDSEYPFRDLAGVGVAFKLVAALARARGLPEGQELRFLDLVCLGTVADVVPLLGENRLFVQHGLRQLTSTRKVGVAALVESAGVRGAVASRHVAFALAPRINAAGRMNHAEAALRLMLTKDAAEAESLAAHLSEQNERRRQEERETVAEARAMIEAEVALDADKVIVLASEGWHPGVIGIVASRLVDIYHRPVLLVAIGDGIGKGSGRSVGGLDLWKALRRCGALLTHFGGHEYAAGFRMMPENLGALRERINEVADEYLSAEDLVRHVTIDLAAEFRDLTPEALTDLNRLAPFGVGNPTPVLMTRKARVHKVQKVGRDGSHLSLWLAGDDGCRMGAVWFGGAEAAGKLPPGARVHVCYKPRLDEWQGRARVRLHVEDIALETDFDDNACG